MNRNFVFAAFALSLVLPLAGSVALAQAATDPAAQNQAQMHAIGKNTKQQLAGVLTPEQMQQWKAMRKSREQKRESAPTGA